MRQDAVKTKLISYGSVKILTSGRGKASRLTGNPGQNFPWPDLSQLEYGICLNRPLEALLLRQLISVQSPMVVPLPHTELSTWGM